MEPSPLTVTKRPIANRIACAASEVALSTVAIHSADDARSLRLRVADEVRPLPGQGAAACLNAADIIAAAKSTGRGAIYPGHGN